MSENKTAYIDAYMQTLAGEGIVLTPRLVEIFSGVLARQLEEDDAGNITQKGNFETLAKVFTFVSSPVDERPASPLTYAEDLVQQAEDAAEAAAGDQPAPITFTLTASDDSINEGEANTFTVTASRAVEEDTVVTFQLKIDADGDTAQLADFNAGAFNADPVTIAAGETTATFDVTAITNDGTEVSEKYTVEATVNGETLSEQVTILDGSVGAGQTFILTTGLDIIPGMEGSNGNTVTSGDDQIIGVIDTKTSANSTFNATDLIDAGEGTDTFKVVLADDASTTNTLPTNFEGVEIVEVQSNATGTFTADVSAIDGITNLNITKAAAIFNAIASATTDIDVSMKASGADLDIEGGKDVNVAITNVSGVGVNTIDIGGTTPAKGDVTVSATGKAVIDGGDVTLGQIDVVGGTTVSVVQTATSDASAAAAGTTGTTYTQGAVNVTADATTSTVTVTQDKAVTEVTGRAAVAGEAATQEVTFGALTAGQTAVVIFGGGDSLTFTAKKDLTAAQVAEAFANLAVNANQGSASAELGIYTDVGDTNGWTSGAATAVSATQSKVVFSNSVDVTPTVGENNVITVGGTGTGVGAVVNGTAAVTARTGVLGIDNGVVDIDDTAANSIKTITVDGYANNSLIGAADVTATEALETLTLKNAQGTASMTVDDTAAALALTVEGLGSTTADAVLSFTDAPTTLNVTSTGNNYVNLTAAATTALNVGGTGLFDIDATELAAVETVTVTDSAGLKLNGAENDTLTSVNTTGTTGTVTATINGDAATYTGGAGVDNVTIANAGTVADKAIDLGAGNDMLDMSSSNTPATPSVVIEGGEGTDTIKLTLAGAAAATVGSTLEAGINSFERLEVEAGNANTTVNLDNLDDINYVISNGNNNGGTPAVVTYDIAGLAMVAADTLTFGGTATETLYTAAGAENAAAIAGALNGTTKTVGGATYNVTAAGTVLTFTATSAVTTDVSSVFGLLVDSGVADITSGAITNNGGNGVDGADPALTTTTTLTNMLEGATVQLDAAGNVEVRLTGYDGITDTTGATDTVNVVTNAANSTTLGTFTADKVESINIETKDTTTGLAVSTNTMVLDADKAGTIDISGAGNLVMTLSAATTEVTAINAGTMTGALTVTTLAGDTAATTVTAGSGADTLTAAGANDVLIGGAGNDTLLVTTGTAVTMTGGAGTDAFDVSGFVGSIGGAATITDFTVGETIKFATNPAADFNSSQVTLIEESTFTEFVNEAYDAAGGQWGIAWFQFNNNTFAVQDTDGNGSFTDGADIIVKLSGLHDLSDSSFNDSGQGTLLYI